MRSAAILVAYGGLLAAPVSAAPTVAAAPTFADVLTAPDDPAINIAYARAQVAEGNMLYAAAAYERLLLERPDQDGLRLDYIDVLLNLDDGAAAQRELDKLTGLRLPPAQQTQLAGLRQRLTTLAAASAPGGASR